MSKTIIKIKRIIKEGFFDLINFGPTVAFAKIRWIFSDESLNSIRYRNKIICKYITKKYLHIIQKYQNIQFKKVTNEKTLWVFWWTGEESMPEVIQMCTKSKIKAIGCHKIVILSKDNIRDYISFPNVVWEQFENKKLKIQHLADMIRVQLIQKYGGIWLDASIFCTENIPENLFDLELFSIKSSADERYVSKSRWTTFAIGGQKDNVLCSFLNEFFIEYCKSNKPFIDYFMFDCAINVAYDNIINVKNAIDTLDSSEKDYYWLDKHLRKNLPVIEINNEKPYIFQKLSWQGYVNDIPDKDTLYYRLIEKEFNNE